MSHCVAIQVVLVFEAMSGEPERTEAREGRVITGRQRWVVAVVGAIAVIVCWAGLAVADSLTSSPPAPLFDKRGPVEPINRQNFAWMNRLTPVQHQSGDPLMGNRW